jgi:trehalose 6-phosphate phosphatase
MRSAAELVDSLRAGLEHTLVALDFDGTLAPIVADPSQSRPAPGTAEALVGLAARGATIALITGRDARTVLDLSGLARVPGLIVEGVYGAERWRAGTLSTPDTPSRIERLRTQLPAVLQAARANPAVWIEDKRLSLVVHGRKAADPEGALAALQAPVAALARDLGFEVHPGRGVIELRLPGFDKGAALGRLVADSGVDQVLFAGDDVGDLPAFERVAEFRSRGLNAWSVGVVTAEVPEIAELADVSVPSPAELVALLSALAG